HAQEQAREPVGEVAADEEQMIVLELVEELLRHQVLALQGADELEQILIGDDVGRGGRQLSEQVVDDRALQPLALRGQINHPVGQVRQHVRRGGSGKPLDIDRRLEQRIGGSGDEQVEV